MALRWRKYCTGDIVCAAKSEEEPEDTYIDDALHYRLAVILKIFIPDKNEKENGLWRFKDGN